MEGDDASSSTPSSRVLDNLNGIIAQLGMDQIEEGGKQSLPSIQAYYPDLDLNQTEFNKTGSTESITSSRIIFWYHPDYLSSVDLITDKYGNAHEFFMYNPWGEQMHQWTASTYAFSSPYRFNGKELDPETGLAYYGARYYQNKLSLWLSVDPLATEYPNVTPYSFSNNNPIALVDPDGRDGEVRISGNDIIITVNILVYGSGATAQNMSTMENNMNSEWNSQGWTYTDPSTQNQFTVKFEINVLQYDSNNPSARPSAAERNNTRDGNNYVEIDNNLNRSSVTDGDEGSWRGNGRGNLTLAQDDPSPHELGHLLGLPDRYDANGAQQGWQGNIMAEPAMNGAVEQRDINTILRPIVNQYLVSPECTVNENPTGSLPFNYIIDVDGRG